MPLNKEMTPLQRLIGMFSLEQRDIAQIIYYAVFSGIVSLSLPLGIQAIINLVQGAQLSTSWIVLTILVPIGVIFSGILQYMQMRIIETIQQRIFTRASFELSYRFPRIKISELQDYYPPELANRFFDTLTIQKGLSKLLIDMPSAFLQIAFTLILLSFYHPFFIIFGLLTIFLIYLVFWFTFQKGLKSSLDESQRKYKVAHWIQEIARTLISFKISGNANFPLNKNDLLVSEYLKARESHFKIIVIQFSQMIGFKVVVTAALLSVGGALVLNQQMNIGQFVASEIIILLVISSVEKLIMGLETIYDVLTSIEKLGQILDKELEIEEGLRPVLDKKFLIELDSVSLKIPNRRKPVLDDISLKVDCSSRIIITGESGSGKSTLLRVIAGTMEPTSGGIFVNERSFKSLHLHHYWHHLGTSLLQENPFEGTIEENITMGDSSISRDEVTALLPKLKLQSFIKEQSKGLETMIYPEGKQLSYGTIEKILLARAVIKKPKLLILEDPLNQVDNQQANDIIDFLTDPKNLWGLVVVSHNPRWQRCCNQLIHLKNGSIISTN